MTKGILLAVIFVIFIIAIVVFKKDTKKEKSLVTKLTREQEQEIAKNLVVIKTPSDDLSTIGWSDLINYIIPSGVVVAWSGDITQIPTGWALCDGTKSTPDLRSRFIIGYNPNDIIRDVSRIDVNKYPNAIRTKKDYKEIGGEEQHTLLVKELPAHSHPLKKAWKACGDWDGGCQSNWVAGTATEYLSSGTFDAGENIPHNNLPPYMALAYIMKL